MNESLKPKRRGSMRDRIFDFLLEHGPHSTREIADEFGVIEQIISSAINHARKSYGTEVFYIKTWRKCVGYPGRDTRLYAAGPGKDKKKPKVDLRVNANERSARYREKMHARKLLMSRKGINHWAVALGVTGGDYRKMADATRKTGGKND